MTASSARIVAAVRVHSVCVLSSVCATTADNSGVYVYYLKGIVSVRFRCPARTVGFSGTRLSPFLVYLQPTKLSDAQALPCCVCEADSLASSRKLFIRFCIGMYWLQIFQFQPEPDVARHPSAYLEPDTIVAALLLCTLMMYLKLHNLSINCSVLLSVIWFVLLLLNTPECQLMLTND